MNRILLGSLLVLTSLINCQANQLNSLRKVYEECANRNDTMKCLKIKALKLVERAIKMKKFEMFGWIELRQEKILESNRTGRMIETMGQNEEILQKLDERNVTDLLYDSANNFLETHSINLNLPKLIEEARGRRKKNRYAGPFLAALAIKGVITAMAYKSIAVMAGTALIVGKMALVLAAILGLKKIISGDKEKTTVEIIKHPTHSNTHSFSSSYEEGEGHYRRSINPVEDIVLNALRSQKYE